MGERPRETPHPRGSGECWVGLRATDRFYPKLLGLEAEMWPRLKLRNQRTSQKCGAEYKCARKCSGKERAGTGSLGLFTAVDSSESFSFIYLTNTY